MIKKFKRILCITLSVIIAFLASTPTSAIADWLLDFYDLNGIYYYNPDGLNYDCSSGTNGNSVTMIGGGIADTASQEISTLLPEVEFFTNANGSLNGALNYAQNLFSTDQLRKQVVIAVDNADISYSDILSIIQGDLKNYQLYFIINNSSVRSTINEAAESNNVQALDWASLADSHPEYMSNGTLSEEGKKAYANLVGSAVGGPNSTTGGLNNNYVNYAGDAIIKDPTQIEGLEKSIPIYETAIREEGGASVGITWPIMAAIHYNENGFSWHNTTNQGVFGNQGGDYEADSDSNETQFLAQAKQLVRTLKQDLGYIGGTITSDESVKQLFYVYNSGVNGAVNHSMDDPYYKKAIDMGYGEGGAAHGEGSAYVMNRYDSERDPTLQENKENPDWKWRGVWTADGVYDANETVGTMGAYTIYAAIGGNSICGGYISDGGLSESQARQFMEYYYSSNVQYGTHFDNANGKDPDKKSNCVTFVEFFVQNFTTLQEPSWRHGKYVVGDLANLNNLETGTEPRPFAVFSTPLTGEYAEYGHTGVILGIDKVNDRIFIGEASYGYTTLQSAKNYSFTRISMSLSTFLSKTQSYTYAYIPSDKLKLDAISAAVEG